MVSERDCAQLTEEKYWPQEELKVESSYQPRSQFVVTFCFPNLRKILSGELYEKYCVT